MTRECKFKCGVLLGDWDDEAKKYREAGSGGLHTKERCEEMKAKARQAQGEKNHNNHGNEDVGGYSIPTPTKEQVKEVTKDYLDHTLVQPQKLKLKVLTSTEAEGLALLYNTFGESHNIRYSQYRPVNALYTIAVFFEEVPLKQ